MDFRLFIQNHHLIPDDWIEFKTEYKWKIATINAIDMEQYKWIRVECNDTGNIYTITNCNTVRMFGRDEPETKREKERRIETEAINKAVASQHMRMVEVSGDGNCLFRSLSLGIYNHQDKHREIRQEIVGYMQNHHQVFRKWIADFETVVR